MAVPLTLQAVLNDLAVSVNRPDLAAGYTDAFNRAVRDTAAAHSFDQMKKTGSLVLNSGQSSVSLTGMDANWKEPQNERFWAYVSVGGAAVVPLPIYTRGELERLQRSFLPNPYLVYFQDGNAYKLGLLPPATAAANYAMSEIHYFAYPAAVTDPTLGTPLLTFYPNMILSKTRALIFQSINDPIWETHDQAWKEEMLRWTGVDLGVSQAKPYPEKE